MAWRLAALVALAAFMPVVVAQSLPMESAMAAGPSVGLPVGLGLVGLPMANGLSPCVATTMDYPGQDAVCPEAVARTATVTAVEAMSVDSVDLPAYGDPVAAAPALAPADLLATSPAHPLPIAPPGQANLPEEPLVGAGAADARPPPPERQASPTILQPGASKAGPKEAHSPALPIVALGVLLMPPAALVSTKWASWLLGLRRRIAARRSKLGNLVEQLIAGEPGIHHNELVRRIGRGNGTVEHHVRLLLERKVVTKVENEGHSCYFMTGMFDPSLMQGRSALRGRTRLAVLRMVAAAGPLSLTGLADRVGISPATASHHVSRLARRGLLVAEWNGGRKSIRASQLGMRCMVLGGPAVARDRTPGT